MLRRITAGCLLLTACGGAAAVSPQGPAPVPVTSIAPSAEPSFGRGSITIQAKPGPLTLGIEIADDEAKREYGLMNRRALAPDAGMLFVFDPPADAKQVGFWMKDTLIPLSIAFVEPNMAIESLQEMLPETEQIHYAPRDYAYAIEANQGYFTTHGVALGDKVTIQRT